jgi:four helix bundle protein
MRERTMQMATKVHDLFKNKKIELLNKPIVSQVIRSSSSVAANYRAATRARSDAEFYAKICIVVEEADETQFWLDYLVRIGFLTESDGNSVGPEIGELVRIFSTTKKTMQAKVNLKSQV